MRRNAKLTLFPEGEFELYLHGVNYAKETYPGLCRNSCSITPSTTSSDKFIMKKICKAPTLLLTWLVKNTCLFPTRVYDV